MSATHEKRSGQDRRQLDLALPDAKERRRLVESRKTTIVEMSISDAEWTSYFGTLAREVDAHASEEATAVFERAGTR